MDAILQAALPKLHIDAVHLRRVLQVTSGLSQTGSVGGYDANHYVVSTVLETLFDGLRNTKPIPPGSINSMMEVCIAVPN